MEDIRVDKVKSGDARSCNYCRARNYDTSVVPAVVEKADELYELCIDHARIALCKKCLTKVYNAVGSIVAPEKSGQ